MTISLRRMRNKWESGCHIDGGPNFMWETYYIQYNRRLIDYLRTYNKSLAEDWAQETWLKVSKNINSFTGDFWPYLWKVGRSVAIDELRRLKLAKNGLKIDSEGTYYPNLLPYLNLDRLTPVQEEVVLLRLKGLKYPQISRITGYPVGTLCGAYTTAVIKLRQDLVARGLIDGEGLDLKIGTRSIQAYKKRQKK